MARPLNRLSARTVATAKKPGYYPDGGGLYLRIGPAGTKSWVFRFKRHGKLREMGLGSLTAVGLVSARESATDARLAVAQGKDPIDVRRAGRAEEMAALTFAEAAAKYIGDHRAGWKSDKHADQWTNTLATYAEPVIGKRIVDAVTTDDVLTILKPIWRTKTETATRVRQRIECVIDAEFARRHLDRMNPARWRGHMDKLLPKPRKVSKVRHFAALHYREMPALMGEIRSHTSITARALEFTILTNARTHMVLGVRRPEIHANGDEGPAWTIPARRMKGDVEFTIPLSEAAQAVLDSIPKERPRGSIFRAWKGVMSNNAMRQFLQQQLGHPGITVHGMRSAFRDWAGNETEFAKETIEEAMAHRIKDEAEAAYRRLAALKKRRALMEAWAEYLTEK